MENKKIDKLIKQLFNIHESDGTYCIMGFRFIRTDEARTIINKWSEQVSVESVVILRERLINKRNKYKERYLKITKLEKKIALGGKIKGYAEAIQYMNNLIDKSK